MLRQLPDTSLNKFDVVSLTARNIFAPSVEMVSASVTWQDERFITFWAVPELVQVFVNRDILLSEAEATIKTGAGISKAKERQFSSPCNRFNIIFG